MARPNFASPAARSEKGYTWSGSAADGAPARGTNPGHEDSYTATNANTQIFDMVFLKIDSDQAAQTAEKRRRQDSAEGSGHSDHVCV